MNLNFFLIFILMLLFSLELFAVELTPEEQEYLKNKGSIKACVDPDWYPFERLNEKGEHEGIAGDLLRLVAERTGVKLEIVETASWEASIAASKEKKCQILSFLNQTPERGEWLFFTYPYFIDVNVFITRNEHSFIVDPATLTDETIVFPEGTAMEKLIEKDYPNLKIINTKNENDAFILVSEKKADMTMRSLIMTAYTIRKEGLFNLKIAGQLPNYTNQLRIGIIRSEPLLVDIFNKGVRSITHQEREQIVNKHVAIEVKTRIDYQLIFQIVAILGLFILVSVYWNYRLKRLNETLITLSQTDILTHLYNRAKLNEQFHTEYKRVLRYQHPLSVMMIDIDYFKKINDEFGHLIGDQVLIEFAKLAKKSIRHCDTIGRWGGEEFLVLCPETRLEDAFLIAERIKIAVQDYSFTSGRSHTVSVGLATFLPGDTEDSLLKRADQALYKAKSNGRNRVCSI